jgi:hypothetical protein
MDHFLEHSHSKGSSRKTGLSSKFFARRIPLFLRLDVFAWTSEPDAVTTTMRERFRSEVPGLYFRAAHGEMRSRWLQNYPIEIHPKHGGKRIRPPLQGDGDPTRTVPERFCKTGKGPSPIQIQPHSFSRTGRSGTPPGLPSAVREADLPLEGLFPPAKRRFFCK